MRRRRRCLGSAAVREKKDSLWHCSSFIIMRRGCGSWKQKLYDLKISRTISLQTVPQIHLIQKQKKLLADKIQTALFGTIPLWKNQIALALAAIPD